MIKIRLFIRISAILMSTALAGCVAASQPSSSVAIRGANLLQTSRVSFEHAGTRQSLRDLKALGANTVAVVFFLRQTKPTADRIGPAHDVTERQLRSAIRHARRLKLAVAVKPQVLIEKSWAGEINPGSDAAWRRWFAHYRRALMRIASLAEREGATTLFVGTELAQAAERPEWAQLIGEVRSVYRGHLSYAAHGVAEAERFRHWRLLDSIGVTLYEPINAKVGASNAIQQFNKSLQSLKKLGKRHKRPVLIAEIGIPSARDADKKPWAIPSRYARPDPRLQAERLGIWLDALDQPWIHGTLVWCWYSDPRAGGPRDTDFTVQNKPAAQTLACRWRENGNCVTALRK